MEKMLEDTTVGTVQALRGIFIQRVEGRTYMIWDPNADDAFSRAAWLALTNDLRRQKGIKR